MNDYETGWTLFERKVMNIITMIHLEDDKEERKKLQKILDEMLENESRRENERADS